jgi:hypothetical protein
MFSTTVFKHIAPLPTLTKACSNTPNVALTVVLFLMDYIPTDEILDALAPEIGIISFHLGIELGLRAVDLERIQYRYQHDLVKQAKSVGLLQNGPNYHLIKMYLVFAMI